MATYGVWILVVALWQTSTPTIAAYPTAGKSACIKLAETFAKAEDAQAENAYPAFADRYSVSCELKIGGDVQRP